MGSDNGYPGVITWRLKPQQLQWPESQSQGNKLLPVLCANLNLNAVGVTVQSETPNLGLSQCLRSK